FVSAESLALLDDLLTTGERRLLHNAPRISQARIFADGATLGLEIDPPAASISRYDLDPALWHSCLAAGVDARATCGVRSVEGEDPFTLTTKAGAFFAAAVVNAAGRWSFLTSPETRARAAAERWIGVKRHFHESQLSPPV